jgi:probable F420-dependent oxidoreductase
MTQPTARLGLTVPTIPVTPPIATKALELARALRDKGYDEVWMAEVNAADSYALAGALSQAVPDMRLGTGIVPLQTRTVMMHAMGALTLHELTGGKFTLGLGISSENIVRDWAGQPFDRPLTRMRESLTVLQRALAGEKVSFEGETLHVKSFRLAGKAEVPILLGALNPKMLRLAGAMAHGVMLNMVPEHALDQVLAEVRAGAIEAGRDPNAIQVVSRLHVHLAASLAEGRDLVRRTFGPYVATRGYNRFFRWIGMDEARLVAEAFARGDRQGVAAGMSDALCDAVGVTGPEDHVRQRIRDYAARGVQVCVINPISPDPVQQRATFETLADVLR